MSITRLEWYAGVAMASVYNDACWFVFMTFKMHPEQDTVFSMVLRCNAYYTIIRMARRGGLRQLLLCEKGLE